MYKNLLLSGIAILLFNPATAQINFSNLTDSLLVDTTIYSGVAIGISDMNGDSQDDIIRLDYARQVYIEYQNAPGEEFTSFNYGVVGSGREWALCIADVDANGYNDILTGGYYNDLKLLKANNDGDNYSVTDITSPSIFLQGVNFADIDNNGTVDIFACHDDGLSAPFSNDGSGTFTHDINLIDASSTVPSDNSGNYGTVWTDYDNDGDLDMYLSKCRLGVGNPLDGRRINMLFQNDGSNNYTDVAEAAGLRPLAQSWAADFADVDNDGDLDCFIINHDVTSQLFCNNGDGTFTDTTDASGMTSDLDALPLGIQCIFEDFDNDGFVDLLYTSRNGDHLLFQNDGDFTFTTVTDPFPTSEGIQSAVTGDLNNDGYMDVYAGFASGFNNPVSSRPDKLFINDETGSNFFKILLTGASGYENAIGARAAIYGDWGVQLREVRSGESYGIMNSFALHFGLGSSTEIDSLVITWPDGTIETLCGIAADEHLVLEQNNLPDLLESNFTLLDDELEVTFTNTSSGIPDSYNWDFGDGTSSTDENPVHVFPDGGPYTITLTISNDCETSVYSEVWEIGPLPLDLVSFDVQLNEDEAAEIFWTTENEKDVSHFEIEKSHDLETAEVLEMQVAMNRSEQSTYLILDRFPRPGNNYYRLKIVDLNGSFEYSEWKELALREDLANVRMFPNPAQSKIQVISGTIPITSYAIYNVNGQLEKSGETNTMDFEIDLSDLENGIYIAKFKTATNSRELRFTKEETK